MHVPRSSTHDSYSLASGAQSTSAAVFSLSSIRCTQSSKSSWLHPVQSQTALQIDVADPPHPADVIIATPPSRPQIRIEVIERTTTDCLPERIEILRADDRGHPIAP